MQFPLLSRADALEWLLDPLYSSPLGDALRAAYTRVPWPEPTPDDLLTACGIVASWKDRRVAAQQHIRVGFLFARTHQADHEYQRAIDVVDDLLRVAMRARTHGEVLELLAFQGNLYRSLGKFQAAADNLEASLELLYYRVEDEEAIEPSIHLEILSRLATYEYYLGRYEEAKELVEDALRVMPRVRGMPLAAASVIWVQAQLDRMRRAPELALSPSLQVAEVHERVASLASQDRIETFVAEIALDLAEQIPPGPGAMNRKPFLTLARAHRRRAEQLAHAAPDPQGLALARLAAARESRLRAKNEARVAMIEAVIATARNLGDVALQAQALTALGAELDAQREHERAKNCWRQALTVLEDSEVPALSVPPRRALLLANEPPI